MSKLLLATAAAVLVAAAVIFVQSIPLVAAGDSEPSHKGDRLDRVQALLPNTCVDLGWRYTDRCSVIRQIHPSDRS